jgi:hypothetical protein
MLTLVSMREVVVLGGGVPEIVQETGSKAAQGGNPEAVYSKGGPEGSSTKVSGLKDHEYV